ncbi:hypothetical protein ACE6H2_022819 [Prunus campanulata]
MVCGRPNLVVVAEGGWGLDPGVGCAEKMGVGEEVRGERVWRRGWEGDGGGEDEEGLVAVLVLLFR